MKLTTELTKNTETDQFLRALRELRGEVHQFAKHA